MVENTIQLHQQKSKGLRFIHLAIFVLYITVFEDLFTFTLKFAGYQAAWTDFISQISYIAILGLLILDLLTNKRNLFPTLMIFTLGTLLFFITYREFAQFQSYISETYIAFITNSVIIYYIATNIRSYHQFFQLLKPIIILSIVYSVAVYTASKLLGIYADMNIAYGILPATLASLVLVYREKKVIHFVSFAILSIMLFILGNRGTILILFIFTISFTLMHRGKFDIKSFIAPLALFGGLLFMTYLFVSNLDMINNLRFFSILSDKSFFQDSIRLKLWSDGFKFALDNPLGIQGAVFDRIFYFLKYAYTHDVGFYVDETMIPGLYAHNVLVELLMNLGVVVGGIFFLFLTYTILKVLWVHRMRVEFILFLICTGFIHLMYSNSYITSTWFWFMLGAMYSLLHYRKKIDIAIIDHDIQHPNYSSESIVDMTKGDKDL